MFYLKSARFVLLFGLLSIAAPSHSQFWDQGFVDGVARSDFNSSQVGTNQSPLTYGECLYTSMTWMFPCTGNNSWASSNWMSFGNPADGFWVFSANDEPWDHNSDGPPNQSHAIGAPGTPGYGFHFTNIQGQGADDGAHIIINTDYLYQSQYDDWVDIPFFSIGAERDRGNNGTPPAVLNGLDHWMYGQFQYLQFNAQLRVSEDGNHGGSYRHAGFYVLAEWGQTAEANAHPRGIFVVLHEDASSHPDVDETNLPQGWGTLDWNWPFEQSFFYPGADWFFVTIDHLVSFCPQSVLGSSQPLTPILSSGNLTSYKFQLTNLFECIEDEYSPWSTPFPTDSLVDVRGIHWYIEGAAAEIQDTPSVVSWLQINNPRVTRF